MFSFVLTHRCRALVSCSHTHCEKPQTCPIPATVATRIPRVVDNASSRSHSAIVRRGRFLQADKLGDARGESLGGCRHARSYATTSNDCSSGKQKLVPRGMRLAAHAQSRADEGIRITDPSPRRVRSGAFHALGRKARRSIKGPRGPCSSALDQQRFASSPYDPGREALLAAIHATGLAPAGRRVEGVAILLPRSSIGRKHRVRW